MASHSLHELLQSCIMHESGHGKEFLGELKMYTQVLQ